MYTLPISSTFSKIAEYSLKTRKGYRHLNRNGFSTWCIRNADFSNL